MHLLKRLRLIRVQYCRRLLIYLGAFLLDTTLSFAKLLTSLTAIKVLLHATCASISLSRSDATTASGTSPSLDFAVSVAEPGETKRERNLSFLFILHNLFDNRTLIAGSGNTPNLLLEHSNTTTITFTTRFSFYVHILYIVHCRYSNINIPNWMASSKAMFLFPVSIETSHSL